MKRGGGRGRRTRTEETSRLEWVVAIASTLLVLGMLGYLARQASRPTEPAAIALEVDSILSVEPRWLVRFTARNAGTETAAQLQVEGTLLRDGRQVETSTATLDYVPGRGHASGGLFFSNDPGRHRLELRPLGYVDP